MHYQALACDYDGTLAAQGRVDAQTRGALEALQRSGRKLLLVTGRELPELRRIFPELALFDRVVAENGALLYRPDGDEEKLLGPTASPALVARLSARGVPVSAGRAIIATWQPHEALVRDAIRELALDVHLAFNKGAVMVLPSGVNKGTGLVAALSELAMIPQALVGVGDAENDHSFLALCGCAVAVANALPAVKRAVDLVTEGERGAGVVELIGLILASDLREVSPRRERRAVALGRADEDGAPVTA